MEIQDLDATLEQGIKLICEHQGLINAYITDYFVGASHEIPSEWLAGLSRLQPWELGMLMSANPGGKEENLNSLLLRLPASFVVFRERCCRLNVSEGSVGELLFHNPTEKNHQTWIELLRDDLQRCPQHVPAHLSKVIKPKKQHEVLRQGLAISAAARAVNVERVVDVGAGHGHLARVLTFQEGLEVTAIEASDACAPKASKLDQEVTYRLTRRSEPTSRIPAANLPQHVTSFITDRCTSLEDSKDERAALLTGLHACGDLTTTLLRRYCSDHGLRALVSVGCCYMRCEQPWRPMSSRLRSSNIRLSFEGLELACHHLGSYRDRLLATRHGSGTWRLKTQAFRAGFTELLARANHRLRHGTGVRCGMKSNEELDFRRYAETLITRLCLDDLEVSHTDWDEVEDLVEREWYSVIVFYVIRLMLGPVVELLILLDRLFFLQEKGLTNNCLIRIFDCLQSPRNMAIVSWKE